MRTLCETASATHTPALDLRQTEQAIKDIKDFFERALAAALNLRRVTAPLFVAAGSGINDDLNGVEAPVSFQVPALGGQVAEVVQSLAKWKRLTLADLSIRPGEGIYSDMNAIRPRETLDALHSLYVDQWDWERTLLDEQRSLDILERVVRTIYRVIRDAESFIAQRYPALGPHLPDEIALVHAQDLEDRFPDLTPSAREDRIAHEHGAAFIVGIGAPLRSGKPHDGRAPDYDDWLTPNGHGLGLNGDIIVWHPVMNRAVELSSMGIRVNPAVLRQQLALRGAEERRHLYFHRRLLAGDLPASIGGGIGQSRLCMVLLGKTHIGEVQAGLWPEAMREECRQQGIALL